MVVCPDAFVLTPSKIYDPVLCTGQINISFFQELLHVICQSTFFILSGLPCPPVIIIITISWKVTRPEIIHKAFESASLLLLKNKVPCSDICVQDSLVSDLVDNIDGLVTDRLPVLPVAFWCIYSKI